MRSLDQRCLQRLLRLAAALAPVAVCAPLACAGGDAPRTAVGHDDFGMPVRPGGTRRPARIVSLNPTTTELLFAIGAGDRVVGRSHWDVWPVRARQVADLGPALRPNVEAVLARRPDLVVLYASADNREAVDRLRTLGVETLALRTDRIEDFRRACEVLGSATGERARASAVVDSVDRTIARVRASTAGARRPSVFVHVWDSPVMTIGAGSFLDELITIAGGRNVYADLARPSAQVAVEDVVRRDPDLVFTFPEQAARLRDEPAWRAVPAVRARRIVIGDTILMERPSVRLGEAAVALVHLLHPELAQ